MSEDRTREEGYNWRDAAEEHSFDQLARGLASGTVSRKHALKLVGTALLGGVLASIPGVALAIPSCPDPNRPHFCRGQCREPLFFASNEHCSECNARCPKGTTCCCPDGVPRGPGTCVCCNAQLACRCELRPGGRAECICF